MIEIIIVMKNTVSAILAFVTFSSISALGAGEDTFSSIEGHIRSHAHSMADACVSVKAASGAWGSGVVVSESGMIFSAAHVYRGNGEQVTVFLKSGVRAKAQVVKHDTKHDIAVLKLEDEHKVTPAKIQGQGAIQTGKTLVAAGHASGFNAERRSPLRVGFGFHAVSRGMIYTTCRITAGDSGGPLYDEAGFVRGVHHTMDGKGKFSAHVPVQRFFQLWPELAKIVAIA